MQRSEAKAKRVALILAAGRGWRMGGPKALMMVGGRPWWKVQEERLTAAGVEALWVLSRVVFKGMAVGPARFVIAEGDAPMFDSVRVGIAALQAEPVAGVFVLPVDVPAAGRSVWEALAKRDGPVAAARAGVHGHPVYLPWAWAEKVLKAPVDSRLDEMLREAMEYVEVEDEAVVMNLNTPDELAQWLDGQEGTEA